MICFASLDLDGTALDGEGRGLARGLIDGVAAWRHAGVTWHVVTGRPAPAVGLVEGMDALVALCAPNILVDDGDLEVGARPGCARAAATLSDQVLGPLLGQHEHVVLSCGENLLATTRRAARLHALTYRLPQATVDVARPDGPAHRATVYADSSAPSMDLGHAATVRRLRTARASVVTPRGGGKVARYRRHLERYHKTDLTCSIAFGDGDGDAELLRTSAIGVAVDGATPAAVAAASVHLSSKLADFLIEHDPRDLDAGSALIGGWTSA